MSKENPFAIAEGKRIDITNEQAKQIRDMYKSIEKEFGERIRILSNKSNISSIMREQYLKDFTKDLQDRITILNSQLEGTITNNALEVAKAVTEDNDKMLREMGFGGVFTSDFHIPQDAVNSIITGKLYEGKWTLSKAIWSDNQKKLNDINSIVAKGLAENKSTYELAKDLERYVNPQARKEWSWSKVYPGTSKKIDYNAQRLARTMISHAYQESFVLNTKDNPFIEAYQWLASGGDRMCDICAERDGKIYQKDELPLDHPNGMCTFMIVKEKSYEEIAKDLSNWVNGTGDSELNEKLDKYAETLGYNVKEWTKGTQPVQEAKENASYSVLTSQSESEAFFEDMSNKWERSLTNAEEVAINEYTMYNNKQINEYLRDGKISVFEKEELQKEINLIDSALAKFELQENVTLYRAGNSNDINKEFTSFVSTSASQDLAKSYLSPSKGADTLYIIQAMQGIGKGAYVASISEVPEEQEFLLNRGMNPTIIDEKIEEINGSKIKVVTIRI